MTLSNSTDLRNSGRFSFAFAAPSEMHCFNSSNTMKGITYITDERNRKKAVVIGLKALEHNDEEIHEFIDVLIAESRKNDEVINWEDAKKQLRKKDKL
mgnify:CR=1 FL=1